ncbi:MAG: tRNA uridine-5-carboxymethylaminomethyl(34) synthesis GTPase MnmE [Candidatus Cloacimonetes bacterium]|nr:tRNA uridine-5-carboxymethylaminomethyl(34) synthesis GTPase MnmE [Candidatus Cloacimonadota bacterium]
MTFFQDSIVAISTPYGSSGIAVIRLSGENSIEIVDLFFKGKIKLEKVKSNSIIYGKIQENKHIIDDVLISIFRAPHSYTGENVVEISCHGNMFIANKILELLLTKCRLAEKGEFTQRAFLNNKMDLTEAEAVGDLLNAKTNFSHIAAMEQLHGSLHNRISKLLTSITDIRTLLELEIDFLEQDLPFIDIKEIQEKIRAILIELENLVITGEEGLILREGLMVSLVGAPNVGKSSIFNSLLETERAIVTPIPGTTRDYLEEAISLKGYLVRIFDTAGIRNTDDSIEKIGIERSFDIVKKSHKVLFIIDGKENLEEYKKLGELIDEQKIIKVLNKADLFEKSEIDNFIKKNYIICSTTNKNGLESLKEILLKDIEISEDQLHKGILSNARHIAAVKKTIESIKIAIQSIDDQLGFEFTAFDLKEASSALEEIIGIVSTDDFLNKIFDNFCIGK